MTNEQRRELTAHLSSHIIKNEITTFENSLNAKVSKIGNEIKNDPDVQELKSYLDGIKTPLEHETIQHFNRINSIKREIIETENSVPMERLNNFDVEKRKKEIKTKLNTLYKRLIDSITNIDFSTFAKLPYPEDLKQSFDR
jgi:ribosomal 50S subunit-associated protein YjgA (DUF615 family)